MIRLDSSDIIIAQSTHAGETGKNNEDRLVTAAFRDTTGEVVTLVMVADGIGGHAAGEIASDLAVRSVYDHLERGDSRSPLDTLEAALLAANHAIYERSRSEPQFAGMGSTAVVALLVGHNLFVAHVGDSRMYLIRGDAIQQLTVDHTWVQEAMSAGLLTKEEARKHPNRHVIRRYLGHDLDTNPIDLTFKLAAIDTPEQMERNQGTPLKGGDKLLLCSDGLTDLVEDDEIWTAVTQNDPQEACEQLVLLARQRGGFDNITVVLATLPAQPQAPPTRLASATPAAVPLQTRRPRRRSRVLVFGLIVVGVLLVVGAVAGGAALLFLNRGSLVAPPTLELPTAAPTLEGTAATAGAALPPGGDSTATATPEPSETATETALPSETPTETATAEAMPMVSITTDAVVRVGPDPDSLELGTLLAGSTAVVHGRDPDGLWWYVEFPTGTASRGWVFQAVTTWTFDAGTIPVVNAVGTPVFTASGSAPSPGDASGPSPGESATPQG